MSLEINGRMVRKSTCASCGITKTKFVKTNDGAIDIYKAMLPLLPKKCLTLPEYIYCGPGNPLDLGKSTYELDEICLQHVYCYSNGLPKSECDKEMLKDLGKSKNKTFGENVAKNLIVKPIIGTKYKLGLITSLAEERANLSAFRTFVRFALGWFCLFPHPLGVWEGLQ